MKLRKALDCSDLLAMEKRETASKFAWGMVLNAEESDDENCNFEELRSNKWSLQQF